MDYYIDQFITSLIPVLTPVIIGAVTWLIKEAIQLMMAKRSELKNKELRNNALDLWYKVEEYYRKNPEVQRVVNDKYDMLKSMLKAKYPSITDEQIDDLIESISGLINYKKVEGTETVETPVENSVESTVTVQPVVKYVAPDGTELQPVANIENK